jgi:mannose-6-phosphate isomerase-like protein (cupin superfamily)
MTLQTIQRPQPLITALDEDAAEYFLGLPSWVRATAAQTGGSMGIVEQEMPAGFASPYHVHHREDELWYVLEGEVRFVSGPTSIAVPRGGIAFLPKSIPHGFQVVGKGAARMLCVTTPAGFEAFIDENSDPTPPIGGPDMARLMATTEKHGLEILGALPDLG